MGVASEDELRAHVLRHAEETVAGIITSVGKSVHIHFQRDIQLDRFFDDALHMLIESYTAEAGVRELERTIGTLVRKAAAEMVEKDALIVDDNHLEALDKAFIRTVEETPLP